MEEPWRIRWLEFQACEQPRQESEVPRRTGGGLDAVPSPAPQRKPDPGLKGEGEEQGDQAGLGEDGRQGGRDGQRCRSECRRARQRGRNFSLKLVNDY